MLYVAFPARLGVQHNDGTGSAAVDVSFGFNESFRDTDCRLAQHEIRVSRWDPATQSIAGDGWAVWKTALGEVRGQVRFAFDAVLTYPPP